MSKKNPKSKSRLSVKIILAVVITTIIAMTVVAAATGSTYEVEIIDGETRRTVNTRIEDVEKILQKHEIEIGENDLVDTTDFSVGNTSVVKILRACHVTIDYYGKKTDLVANGNVTDAIEKAGIKLTRFDNVNHSLTEDLTENMHIVIQRGTDVKIKYNGETKNYNVPMLTVGDALLSAEIKLGKHDEVKPSIDTPITSRMEIEVLKVTYKERVTVEKVSFETKKQETTSIPVGETKVKTEGVDGEKKVLKKEKYVDGKYDSFEVISETVTKKPVDEVVIVGVKNKEITTTTTKAETTVKAIEKTTKTTTTQSAAKPVDGKPSQSNNSSLKTISNFTLPSKYSVNSSLVPTSYKKKLTGSATAYYGGYATSTGKTPQPGYIAVDPDIIPYGTEMWIVSNDGKFVYGYSIAADTGGFIYYGTTLADLYFNTYDECVNFGRRDITIYIL